MSEPNEAPDGFLSRWSRRKALVRQGTEPSALLPESTPVRPEEPIIPRVRGQGRVDPGQASILQPEREASPVQSPAAAPPLPPTLEDVALLSRSSDYRRFVAPDVTPEVKNAAMKKLFTDPHFNVMDGLDTYIDDYGKPDPIPASMLRLMVQSQALGLFAAEEKEQPMLPPAAAGATPDGVAPADAAQLPPEPSPSIADDQDAAVRLQPLDAAGPPSDPGGARPDPGRER